MRKTDTLPLGYRAGATHKRRTELSGKRSETPLLPYFYSKCRRGRIAHARRTRLAVNGLAILYGYKALGYYLSVAEPQTVIDTPAAEIPLRSYNSIPTPPIL
ncbi:hypothetical protein GOBAR_DD23478 [Gossypium barbadense]|nr:hypothetical protein GOBAR_DD23478 [Gossypium barbadense]